MSLDPAFASEPPLLSLGAKIRVVATQSRLMWAVKVLQPVTQDRSVHISPMILDIGIRRKDGKTKKRMFSTDRH